jgi:hypothetical protein
LNIPVGIAASLLAMRLVPESKAEKPLKLDTVGVFLVSTGLFALMVPLVFGREYHWPLLAWVSLVASVPTLAAFVQLNARRARMGLSPLVEISLFRFKSYSWGLAIAFLYSCCIGPFIVTLGVLYQMGFGYSVMKAGLLYLPFAISFLIFSRASASVAKRIGSTLHVGIILMLVGLFVLIGLLTFLGGQTPITWIAIAVSIYGCGQGFVTGPLMNLIISAVPAEDVGSASGVVTTVQQIGYSMGMAVVGGFYFYQVGSAESGLPFISCFPVMLRLNVALLVSTLIMIYMLPKAQPRAPLTFPRAKS